MTRLLDTLARQWRVAHERRDRVAMISLMHRLMQAAGVLSRSM
jgi:hypothetical protein